MDDGPALGDAAQVEAGRSEQDACGRLNGNIIFDERGRAGKMSRGCTLYNAR